MIITLKIATYLGIALMAIATVLGVSGTEIYIMGTQLPPYYIGWLGWLGLALAGWGYLGVQEFQDDERKRARGNG